MRVLGVDPGLTRCGLAIVDELSGKKVKLETVMVFRTDSEEHVDRKSTRLNSSH